MAISAKFGYESRNQSCTISLIEYLIEENKIELDSKFIEMLKYEEEQKDKDEISLIDMREDYTYGSKISVGKERIDGLVKACQELIEDTKSIVHNKENFETKV